jgi:L-seryl-tRNA(Ser) seleniumtransferase
MIAAQPESIRARARSWAESLGQGAVISGQSTVGGGSLPGETLPTWLLSLNVPHPNRTLARLREADPPIIARLEEDRLVLDPRTVLPEQEESLLIGIRNALSARN